VTRAAGGPVTFLTGGRGRDQNGDHVIENREGISAVGPRTIIDDRDGFRQSVVDFMQLVREIQGGMDVDGDGTPDLDASRISVSGVSLGALIATDFLAVEPDVGAGALTVPGGPRTTRRLTPGGRGGYGEVLAARTPSLLSPPGLTSVGGLPVPGPFFNENLPLRDQPPLVNTVPGAMAIQEYFENAEWALQAANPVAYAAHLRKDPLPGVPAKSVLVLFAKGDRTVPNPATTALLRAGDLRDRAVYFRTDLARLAVPALPADPHTFFANQATAAARPILLAAQQQIGIFLASGGMVITQPEPEAWFETPIAGPLPEDLNYIP
jgi:hypothetical protein